MKHIFIVNPVAGKGKTVNIIPKIKEYFKNKPDDTYKIVKTKRHGHATGLALKLTKKKTGRIYSVGGDGTLNEVLNGMINSDFALGVIPMGSGNDFIKTLQPNITEDNLLQNTIEGKEKIVDCGKANNTYFINIASIGLDAEVALNTKYFKSLPLLSGKTAYIMSILYSVVKNRSYNLTYTVNNKTHTSKHLLIAICNGKYYGGGLMPAPNADIKDGFFDILRVNYLNRIKIFQYLPKIQKGTHTKLKELEMLKAKEFQIQAKKGIYLNLDGEITKVEKAEFKLLPKALKIIEPKSAD